MVSNFNNSNTKLVSQGGILFNLTKELMLIYDGIKILIIVSRYLKYLLNLKEIIEFKRKG